MEVAYVRSHLLAAFGQFEHIIFLLLDEMVGSDKRLKELLATIQVDFLSLREYGFSGMSECKNLKNYC